MKDAGHIAYLVGGGVRDLLLGREPKDFDVATDATPGEVKRLFRNCRLIGRRFRLAHVLFHDEIIEVATFRSLSMEEPEHEGHMLPAAQAAPETSATSTPPDSVPPRPRPPRLLKTEDGMIIRDNIFGTPEEDALRRDFTVNAIFYNIADFSVIDYVGGINDLNRGLIRTIGDPVERFIEDPVRMVRAVRFAALLGFEIEEATLRALKAEKERLALASPARLYDEVLKLFLSGEGEKVYQIMRQTGLFRVIFPKLDEWLETETEGFPNIWIGKALEWVDACIHAGRQVEPQLLFALLFGRFIETTASVAFGSGMHPHAAIDMALSQFLREQAARVLIPKKIAVLIRDILLSRRRFSKINGKAPLYFSRRAGFGDAYAYFRFMSETGGEEKALLDWWERFLSDRRESGAMTAGLAGADRTQQRRRKRRKRPRPEQTQGLQGHSAELQKE